MKCQLCGEDTETVHYLRFYTRKGIKVCSQCFHSVERDKDKPYSKVMEKLAMAEAGYRVNRKKARMS